MKLRLALLVTICVVLHAGAFYGSGPFDDDFITFRYARNLVDGHGLAFNVGGEQVEGFTTPLWLFLVAAALELGIDPVHFGQVVSFLAAGWSAWMLASLWRLLAPERTLPLPALLLALSPVFAWHVVAGLATTLLAALVVTYAVLYESARRRDRSTIGAAVVLALACFLRQEIAVFALPFALVEWRRGRRSAALIAISSLVAWTLFRWFYFGRLVPMTYLVKQLPLGTDLTYGARYLFKATLECGVLVWLALGLWSGTSQRTAAGKTVFAGLVLHTAYVVFVGGDFMPWSRFFVPTLPLLIAYGCVAVEAQLGRALRSACYAALALGLAWPLVEVGEYGRSQRFSEHAFFEARWAELGRVFGRAAAPDQAVVISPVGAFGWYSRLPVVDVLGLTNSATYTQEPQLDITMKGHHRFNASWILEQEPAYMILGNGVVQPDGGLVLNPWERTLFQDARFARDYEMMRLPIPGDAALVFFQRKSAPVLPGATRLP